MKDIVDKDIGNLALSQRGMNKIQGRVSNGHRRSIDVYVAGRKMTTSPIHRFLVYREGLNWVEAQDLKEGDSVAVKIKGNYPALLSKVERDFAYLCGLLLGDGGWTGNSVYLLGAEETSIELGYRDLMERQIGPCGFTDCKPRKDGYKRQHLFRTLKNTNIEAFRFLEGKKSNSKRLPEWIWEESQENVCALIQGLVDSDGTIQGTGQTRIVSKSKDMIEGVINTNDSLRISCKIGIWVPNI